MDEPSATALATVWSRGPWQCVYCKHANGESWVVLYYEGAIAMKRQVLSIEEMRDTAHVWKEAIAAADLPPLDGQPPRSGRGEDGT